MAEHMFYIPKSPLICDTPQQIELQLEVSSVSFLHTLLSLPPLAMPMDPTPGAISAKLRLRV